MKKNLLFCFVTLCAVLFTGCKEDNYAEQYVGVYDLIATPNITVKGIPMLGDVTLPSTNYTVACTIALDGDDGKVIATTDLTEQVWHGTATNAGLQFEPVPISLTFPIEELGEVAYTGVINFPLITMPDGVSTTWESSIIGNVTMSIAPMALPANGTIAFSAVKRAK